jgi:hypothetical protein
MLVKPFMFAGRTNQGLPLASGAGREIEHHVEGDIDEASEVFGSFDVT